MSFTIIAEDAFTKVSEVDINAAHKAAIIKPKTPGEDITFVTATNTSFDAISSGNVPGTALAIALPIQPAFETTMADIGNITKALNATALRPSFTLRAAMKRIIKP